MSDWFAGLGGERAQMAIIWTAGALVLLVVVLVLVRMFRSGSGPFVAGGRNRRPRLAVTDAANVDNNRRLILVRRDDVEHLLLVGGPSDIVVEQNIRPLAPRPQAGPDEAARHQQQRYKAAATPAAAVTTAGTANAQMPVEPVAPAPQVVTPARRPEAEPVAPQRASEPAREAPTPEPKVETPAPSPQPAPPVQQASTVKPPPATEATPPAPALATADSSYEAPAPQADTAPRHQNADPAREAERASLEDEMTRLLEDISDDRR